MLNSSDVSLAALNALPLEVRAIAAHSAYEVSLKNGEQIVHAGKPLPGAMLLAKGMVSINRFQTCGDEVVLCFARQNHWFLGDIVAAHQAPFFDGFAVGNATVMVWPHASFNEAYALNAELRNQVQSSAIFTQQRMLRELEVTRYLTLPQRLARRLLELAGLVGMPINGTGIKLHAPVSHSLLAASLGVTRQRIHSQLREWAQLGWLESHYRDVVLHQPQALLLAAAYA